MKKLICFALAVFLCLGMSFSALAADPMTAEDYKNLTEEELLEIRANMAPSINSQLNKLPEDSHGGIYTGDDGKMHIIPIEDNNLQKELSLLNLNARSSEFVIDEPVKMSYAELDEARTYLREYMDYFGITSMGINIYENSIYVNSEEWTDGEKEQVYQIAGINNIIFGIEVINWEKTIEMNAPEFGPRPRDFIDSKDTRDAQMGKAGTGILNTDVADADGNYKRATIGCSVSVNDGSEEYLGWLTTGHSGKINNSISLGDSKPEYYMGEVSDSQNKRNRDALVIQRDYTSEVYPTVTTRFDYPMLTSDAPSKNTLVYILANGSEVIPAEIIDNDKDFPWREEDYSENYTNMIEMKFRSENLFTSGGDSGSAICTKNANNSFNIVGIYKGTRTYKENGKDVTHAVGTRWDNIEDYFGVTLY